MRRRAAVAAVCAVALPAPAQAGWSEPREIVRGEDVGTPIVVSNGGGAAVALWPRGSLNSPSLQMTFKPPGRPFGSPRELAANAGFGAMAMSPNGTSGVAWFVNGKLLAVRADPAGGFGQVFGIGQTVSQGAPAAAIDDRRELFVAVSGFGGTQIHVSRPGGRFGRPQTLARCDTTPELATNAAGSAAAAFVCSSRVRVAVRPTGDAFGRPLLVPGEGDSPSLECTGVDERGTVTLITTRFDGQVRRVESVLLNRRGTFRRQQFLSPPDVFVSPGVRCAFSPDGSAVLVWTAFDGARHQVYASGRAPFQPFAAPKVLTSQPASVAVAIGNDGHGVAVWDEADPDGAPVAVAAIRPPGGEFGDPQPVFRDRSGIRGSASLIADADGGASLVWQRFEERGSVIRTSDYTPAERP